MKQLTILSLFMFFAAGSAFAADTKVATGVVVSYSPAYVTTVSNVGKKVEPQSAKKVEPQSAKKVEPQAATKNPDVSSTYHSAVLEEIGRAHV